jgi:hypothetical protein
MRPRKPSIDVLDTPAGQISISQVGHAVAVSAPVPVGADPHAVAKAAFDASSVLLPGAKKRIPRRFTVIADLLWADMTISVTALIEEDRDNKPRCVHLDVEAELSDRSVSQDTLRAIPVASLMRYGAQWLVDPKDRAALDRAWLSTFRPKSFDASPENLRAVATVVKQHLRNVARAGGRPSPNEAVQQAFDISRPTAARRIREAKDAGYLPEQLTTKKESGR